MEVKTFTEEGILKSCQECGATVLVKSGTKSCPLCGSTNLETDDTFASDGSCSRMDLAQDWFYDPDIMPASMRMSTSDSISIEKPSTDRIVNPPIQKASSTEKIGGMIVQMYPKAEK